MNKRSFRETLLAEPEQGPSYPTLEDFDRQSRRSFLAKLGAALVSAGGLAALAACGDRSISSAADMGNTLGGDPVQPDARLDAGPPEPDQWPLSGGALPDDARIDQRQKHDQLQPLMGESPLMDARVDEQAPEPSPGFAPAMDARVDEEVPQPSMGKVAPMDARIDQGSCKVP